MVSETKRRILGGNEMSDIKQEVLEKSGILSTLDENGFYKIPDDVEKIRFDIGTSIDAQNSALWLARHKDLFVLGIEPNKDSIKELHQRTYPPSHHRIVSLDENKIKLDRFGLRDIAEHFKLLTCALDSVDEPCYSTFYMTDERNYGCSSLLKPTEKLKSVDVKGVDQVAVMSFAEVLSHVPWDRFPTIDIVKIDAQGKDLDILKSAGDYLEKVKVVHVETTTWGCYNGACETNEIREFMKKNDFTHMFGQVNETYVNNRFRGEFHLEKMKGLMSEFVAE